MGETADSVRPDIEIDVRREPVGVVAIISPWNFPIATPAWKIAPALAFGNAVIWKPANQTPASAVALTEIIAKQDLPEGLFNLVMGPGREVGQRLVESPMVDAISFTGSVPVGRGIAAAAMVNMTKIQMEMGSKNPMVICDDCDLDLAVAHAANAAFGGTGQKCTAASRLIVQEGIHDAFVEKLVAATQALKVGHALEDGTQIGPVVSEGQLAAAISTTSSSANPRARTCSAAAPGSTARPTAITWPPPCSRAPQRHAHQPRGNVRAGHLHPQGGQL